ncbi:hypothetical protein RHMOL_Rhmol02G0037400 [Rhododendron molle]|uniref:Uncharacterized protein n=1 Tax=Rhododendron molle TaxID=49168 RepID=A0ACC0PL07_RHOML|nr:hypothetical protein RHMOL_Rhmol02G0037400 [Rhododendron molle]
MKQRRISGWNFNEDGFELDPLFPTNKDEDPDVVKQVRFGGETVIQNRGVDSEASDSSSPGKVVDIQLGDQMKVCSEMGDNDGGGEAEIGSGSVGRAEVVGSLLFLKKSLDARRQSVRNMIVFLGGGESVDANREEQLVQVIENLKGELESEKKKRQNCVKTTVQRQVGTDDLMGIEASARTCKKGRKYVASRMN